MRELVSRLMALFHREADERALDEDIATHLSLLADEYMAGGMTADEARLAARRAFGGVDQMRLVHRDQRGLPLLDQVSQDVRFAIRLARRDAWITTAATVALALGIGVAATVFVILYGMNLRPLPFDEPEQVVGLRMTDARGRGIGVTPDLFTTWRSAATGFASLSASRDASLTLADDLRPAERWGGTLITANTFAMVRVHPSLGRTFTPDDETPGAAPVAILSHRVWHGRYAENHGIIGTVVRLNGTPTTIVGVMPDGFRFPFQTDIWLPLPDMSLAPAPGEVPRALSVTGRLAPPATLAHAQASLDGLTEAAGYGPSAPEERRRHVRVMRLNDMWFGADQGIPALLSSAVVVVLLVAGANVSTLLLARGAARRREIGIRAALGAGRGRLARQLAVEGVLLAIPAVVLGSVLAQGATVMFRREVADLSQTSLPYWTRFAFDAPVLLFVSSIGLLTSLAASLAPMWQLSRVGRHATVLEVPTTGVSSGGSQRTIGAFLVAQFALTVTLLGAATVLVKSAQTLAAADRAVALDDVLVLQVALSDRRYDGASRRRGFFAALDEQFRHVPGVAAGSYASAPPFARSDERLIIWDDEAPPAGGPPPANVVSVGTRYFEVLGLPLIEGRAFTDRDLLQQDVVIVNARFAALFSPGRSVLGRRVALSDPRNPSAPPRGLTIVGVSPAIRQTPMGEATPVAYRPFPIEEARDARVLVRAPLAGTSISDALRAGIARWDPELALFNVLPLSRLSEYSRWATRVVSTLLLLFASICTLLAAVGLHAMAALGVEHRRREIGVRMALGASPGRIGRACLATSVRQVACGLVLGMAGALAAGAMLSGLLVQARMTDAAVLASIVGVLGLVTAVAVAVPLRRALTVDPALSLRHE
jgi:predicted permease